MISGGSLGNPLSPVCNDPGKDVVMAELTKKELLEEAKKQSEALERISRWRTYSMILSAIGVAVLYAGLTGSWNKWVTCGIGAVLIVVGLAFAIVCNLGIRTGRDNVEKLLNAAEKK